MQRYVWLVFLVCFRVDSVSSLFFLLTHGQQRCFSQHMPDQTPLIGDYRTQVFSEQDECQPEELHVRVAFKGPEDQLLSQFGSEGTFRFTSLKPGGYQICLQRPLSAGCTVAVHLDIRVGERTNNYTEIAARPDKPTELRLAVIRLAEEARHVLREQEYLRVREKRFQEVNHNTNMWILWWPIVRGLYVVTFIIVVTGSW